MGKLSVKDNKRLELISRDWSKEDIQDALPEFTEKNFSPSLWVKFVFKDFKIVKSLSSRISSNIIRLITTHILSGLALHYYKRINTLLESDYKISSDLDESKIKSVIAKKEARLIKWIESDIRDTFQPLLQVNFIKTDEELEEFVDISYSTFYTLQKVEPSGLGGNQLLLFDIPYQYRQNLIRSTILPNIVYKKIIIDRDFIAMPEVYQNNIYQWEVTLGRENNT